MYTDSARANQPVHLSLLGLNTEILDIVECIIEINFIFMDFIDV